jgi:Cys-tRNA(Pro)/Cys-tRNA(Cys) deacylase
MSDTNAVKWLRALGVDFKVAEYKFTEIGAEHAAAATGRPLETVCKTLIVKATGNAFWIAIVPGDQRFDPRRMAAAIGVKHADLAEGAEAVIEESLLALDTIAVNGGRRGVLIEMVTDDLVRVLEAQPKDICR